MIRGHAIKHMVESHGIAPVMDILSQELAEGKVRPEDFSIRELAEAFMGHEWVRRLHERNLARFVPYDPKSGYGGVHHIQEAGEGVDVTAFSHITGQIVYSKIHQGWEDVKERLDDVFETVPTMFDGEKIPGIGQIKGEGEGIHPGMPYPESGFGEHYFETPATTKKGMIVSVTKEAIFFDRTSLVTKRAGEIGRRARMNKLVRQAAVIAGVTVQIGNESFVGNNHKFDGTTYNTYATGANAIGINAKSGTPLVNYTSVETLLLLFAQLTDPDTARPIQIEPDTLIVMPEKRITANRIAKATEVRTTYPGYGDSSQASPTSPPGNVETIGDNPIGELDVISSPLLRQVIIASGVAASDAKDWWFLTEAGKAFYYQENWPLTTVQSPPNSTAEFERDIVLRWKTSERGVPWSADPRFVTKGYQA